MAKPMIAPVPESQGILCERCGHPVDKNEISILALLIGTSTLVLFFGVLLTFVEWRAERPPECNRDYYDGNSYSAGCTYVGYVSKWAADLARIPRQLW